MMLLHLARISSFARGLHQLRRSVGYIALRGVDAAPRALRLNNAGASSRPVSIHFALGSGGRTGGGTDEGCVYTHVSRGRPSFPLSTHAGAYNLLRPTPRHKTQILSISTPRRARAYYLCAASNSRTFYLLKLTLKTVLSTKFSTKLILKSQISRSQVNVLSGLMLRPPPRAPSPRAHWKQPKT
jgi:hypothetical protein